MSSPLSCLLHCFLAGHEQKMPRCNEDGDQCNEDGDQCNIIMSGDESSIELKINELFGLETKDISCSMVVPEDQRALCPLWCICRRDSTRLGYLWCLLFSLNMNYQSDILASTFLPSILLRPAVAISCRRTRSGESVPY